ncbi:phosphotransferase enzyme family protein [Streptomyces sp. H27-D2]|uniref:phosphotransferase enzyme family protein n=1 Tax=Streptomyces sp. H27-D2 TaxID=3046304 RepID=UPI002DBBCC97|nr:aminoglycoside phosphotransferase family protein [Streptomyces sp. H27-D2]MEC4019217.1 aminoglycoside phosphotransferase family protein [Streptomyces sp. H27-D2]
MAQRTFTEERARTVLAAALPHYRDGSAKARLLALGENAVFALDSLSLVVRIGRDLELWDRAARELRVADWLAAEGLPAVRPSRRYGPEQPLPFDGHLVTFWEQLPDPVRPAGAVDLAELLRLVHALPEPDAGPDSGADAGTVAQPGPDAEPEPRPRLSLPRRELLGGVERWLRLAGEAIDPADADYLRGRRDGFAEAAATLTPQLPPGPIHGDALPRNVQVGPDGPVLVDLETFASDLREHDLVVMALSRDRYGLDPAAYDAFTAAYGWDVREWAGCTVLRGARETASCAWVAQHAPGNARALAEFRRRVASLRDDDPTVRWFPF